MERLLAILLLFGSGTAAGAGYFEIRDQDPPPYAQSRAPFVVQLAKQFGEADTLVLGDSLIEQTNLDDVCGRTYNGGIGGARIQLVQAVLPDLLDATNPRRIVIAIGANHFAAGNEIETFRTLYPALVDSVEDYDLVLVGVSNSAAASEIVQQQAARVGATYVAPIAGPLQQDGLHHTVEGSRAYRAAIRGGCDRAQPPQT